jgi:hypothetical protein
VSGANAIPVLGHATGTPRDPGCERVMERRRGIRPEWLHARHHRHVLQLGPRAGGRRQLHLHLYESTPSRPRVPVPAPAVPAAAPMATDGNGLTPGRQPEAGPDRADQLDPEAAPTTIVRSGGTQPAVSPRRILWRDSAAILCLRPRDARTPDVPARDAGRRWTRRCRARSPSVAAPGVTLPPARHSARSSTQPGIDATPTPIPVITLGPSPFAVAVPVARASSRARSRPPSPTPRSRRAASSTATVAST